VAGLGAVAQAVHLPLLSRRHDLFEIGAVCDLSASLRRDVGAQYAVPEASSYDSVQAMLDCERTSGRPLDGVLLLTSGSHAAGALQVLATGTPVLCEKPLAYSLAEADELAATERERGAPLLLLGYMKEYDDAVAALRRRLDDVRDGIRSVEVTILHPTNQAQLDFANLRPSAGDVPGDVLEELRAADDKALAAALGVTAAARLRALYAGVVLGSLVHDIALLRHLVGGTDVHEVDAWPEPTGGQPAQRSDHETPDPPSLAVAGRLAGGIRTRLAWHFLPSYPTYRELITVHHEGGSLELEFGTPYLLNAPTVLRVLDGVGGERRLEQRTHREAFENELVAFHAMVTTGAPPTSGIAEGRADIRTAQQIVRTLARRWGTDVNGEAACP